METIGFILMVIISGFVMAFTIALMFATGWIFIIVCHGFGIDVSNSCFVANGALWIYGILFGVLVLVIVFGEWRAIIQGLHYLFVPHAARKELGKAKLDGKALAEALRRTRGEKPPPAYVSENQEKKARAHAARLRAEAEMVEEAIRRERARAAYDEERKARR